MADEGILGDENTPEDDGPSLYDLYHTDERLEKRGVPINIGAGAELTIARAGGANTKFQRFHDAKMRPYRTQQAAGTMDEKVMRELLAECYAHAIITGWSGVKHPKTGEPLPFSKQNVVDLLVRLPALLDLVLQESARLQNFQLAGVEADAKS